MCNYIKSEIILFPEKHPERYFDVIHHNNNNNNAYVSLQYIF